MDAFQLNDLIWKIGVGFLEFPLVIVSRDRAGFFDKDAFQVGFLCLFLISVCCERVIWSKNDT